MLKCALLHLDKIQWNLSWSTIHVFLRFHKDGQTTLWVTFVMKVRQMNGRQHSNLRVTNVDSHWCYVDWTQQNWRVAEWNMTDCAAVMLSQLIHSRVTNWSDSIITLQASTQDCDDCVWKQWIGLCVRRQTVIKSHISEHNQSSTNAMRWVQTTW